MVWQAGARLVSRQNSPGHQPIGVCRGLAGHWGENATRRRNFSRPSEPELPMDQGWFMIGM